MRCTPIRGGVSDYPAQTVAGKDDPAMPCRGDHDTFIVLFYPATSLPTIVGTRDFDLLDGDVDYDETFVRPARIGREDSIPPTRHN